MKSLDSLQAYSITEERAGLIARALQAEAPEELEMSGRGVVFLTGRCNLRCRYCKSRGRDREFPAPLLFRIMGEWRRHGCRYLHLTGGEPTLHPRVEEIIDHASTLGMRVSLSTNGLAGPEIYKRLIRKGLRYVYLSLDAMEEEKFNAIVGRRGRLRQALDAVDHIVRLRDTAGSDVSLTINIVLFEENIDKMERLVRGIARLRPNDFKLIPTTRFLARSTQPQRDAIRSLLENTRELQKKFPFFAYRLKHLTKMRGLREIRYRNLRCYLALDERVIDARGAYPCSIYKREGGVALNSVQDSFEEQRRRALGFVRTHRPAEDPICREFCCDITRDFNLRVQRLVGAPRSGRGECVQA